MPGGRTTPTPDGLLVARMAAGDESALGALYDRFAAGLYALAHRILGDRDDAEEVVMDALVQAWRGAETYSVLRGSVGAWLVVLTRSRALDRRRARERRAAAEGRAAGAEPELVPAMGTPPAAAHEAAESSDALTQVQRALAGLPEPQRTCLELAYFGGLSQSEVAARLDVPLGTIKTRTRQGLIRLREQLAPLMAEAS